MDIKDITSRLAFQADRRILNAEEEDHIRMDISAHEKLKPYKEKKLKQNKLPLPEVRRFALTTATIFLGLFFITNVSAYSQIFMANIKDYMAARNADSEVGDELVVLDGPTVEEPQVTIDPDNEILPVDLTPTTYENQLRIPSIEVDSRIVEPELGVDALLSQDWNELEDQIRSSLLQGVVHYPGTAEAGERGNFFLTGHSSNVFWEVSPYNTVFALLPKLEVGADIYVTYNQKEYHYRVIETKEVSPKDVSVLEQGENHRMTLMTCTPVGTTLKRLVVTAELVED